MDRTQKQQLVETLQQDLADTACVVVTHQIGPECRRGHPVAAPGAQRRRRLSGNQEPAGAARSRRYRVRAAVAAVHRPDRDRLLARPGGRGKGGRRVCQPQRQADDRRRRARWPADGCGRGSRNWPACPRSTSCAASSSACFRRRATRLAVVLQAPAGQIARVLAAHAEQRGRGGLARLQVKICKNLIPDVRSRRWLIWRSWSTICRP